MSAYVSHCLILIRTSQQTPSSAITKKRHFLSKCKSLCSQALHGQALLMFSFVCVFCSEGPPPLPVREKDSPIQEVHSGRAVIGKCILKISLHVFNSPVKKSYNQCSYVLAIVTFDIRASNHVVIRNICEPD